MRTFGWAALLGGALLPLVVSSASSASSLASLASLASSGREPVVTAEPAPIALLQDEGGARHGLPVPPVQRTMNERGLGYLVARQQRNGSIGEGTGVTAICLMALIASGEDPNFGRYAEAVRNALRYLVRAQDTRTGYIPSTMYEHGFAMLAIGECYGVIDERLLWLGEKRNVRSLGETLELAVRCAVTSQEQNPHGAWRYDPRTKEADTSAAGAVLMGLFSARNAGIAVPDEALEKALQYYQGMTMRSGIVGYSGPMGHGDSHARSAICALVFAIAKRKESDAYLAALDYVSKTADEVSMAWPEYRGYYLAQALFQGNYPLWRRWTRENTQRLAEGQQSDGSILIEGAWQGPEYQTGMALLSAALNYCFLPIYER